MRYGVWKRALVALMLLAFFLGTAGQAVSGVVPEQSCAMTMTSSDDAASAEGNCGAKASSPICMDMVGCATSVGLANATTPSWASFGWTALQYWNLASVLTGQALRPELDPPIPA